MGEKGSYITSHTCHRFSWKLKATSKALSQQMHLQFAPQLQHPVDSTHWYFMAFLLWSVNCVLKLLAWTACVIFRCPTTKPRPWNPDLKSQQPWFWLLWKLVCYNSHQLPILSLSPTCNPNFQQNCRLVKKLAMSCQQLRVRISQLIQDNLPPNDTHQIARFGSLNRGPPKNSWETFEPSAISK